MIHSPETIFIVFMLFVYVVVRELIHRRRKSSKQGN